MRSLSCLAALLIMQAVAQAIVPDAKDVVGTWQAQRNLTFLELHANFTYDRYFADVFDQGRWSLRDQGVLQLSAYSAADKKVVTERYRISRFASNVMSMRGADRRPDVWKKINYSRHMPRLSR
jgi:hypothetical protein